jgi:hypothetical protein
MPPVRERRPEQAQGPFPVGTEALDILSCKHARCLGIGCELSAGKPQ